LGRLIWFKKIKLIENCSIDLMHSGEGAGAQQRAVKVRGLTGCTGAAMRKLSRRSDDKSLFTNPFPFENERTTCAHGDL
jgi:hypothetical protein